jgi:hypothetical protein
MISLKCYPDDDHTHISHIFVDIDYNRDYLNHVIVYQ